MTGEEKYEALQTAITKADMEALNILGTGALLGALQRMKPEEIWWMALHTARKFYDQACEESSR